MLLVCTHPVAATHESLVHGLLSSQLFVVPAQVPFDAHTSFVVQAELSLHVRPATTAWLHAPVVVLHVSSVHGLASSQVTAVPEQEPSEWQ